jgi:hypothetical protein
MRRGLRIIRKNPQSLAQEAIRMAELVDAGLLIEARKLAPKLRQMAERIIKEY